MKHIIFLGFFILTLVSFCGCSSVKMTDRQKEIAKIDALDAKEAREEEKLAKKVRQMEWLEVPDGGGYYPMFKLISYERDVARVAVPDTTSSTDAESLCLTLSYRFSKLQGRGWFSPPLRVYASKVSTPKTIFATFPRPNTESNLGLADTSGQSIADNYVIIVTPDNRARLCPRPDCGTNEHLLRMPTGVKLKVIETTTFKHHIIDVRWFKVEFEGQTGWVSEFHTSAAQEPKN